ncbi:MAG: hypothetical protein JWN86_2449 [Planctomycetota bacterium]|nr:hypothetical protein [Planctomycetota bacterium]
MLRFRMTLGGLFVAVMVTAVELSALAKPSYVSAPAAFLLAIVVLLCASIGARFGREPRASWWGFALFGWAYFGLAFGPWMQSERDDPAVWKSMPPPTEGLLLRARETLYDSFFPADGKNSPEYTRAMETLLETRGHFMEAGHSLFALLFAMMGAVLGPIVASGPPPPRRTSAARSVPMEVLCDPPPSP